MRGRRRISEGAYFNYVVLRMFLTLLGGRTALRTSVLTLDPCED